MSNTRHLPQPASASIDIPEEKKARLQHIEDVPGYDFLIPLEDLSVEAQLGFLEILADENFDGSDMAKVQLATKYMRENFVVDEEGFKKFAAGRGAIGRISDLLTALGMALGNDEA